MLWHRINQKPLTTESETAVVSTEGQPGWVSVRHVSGCPRIYGGVWSESQDARWGDGTPVERRCLDRHPTIR
jgi:hypothetical protein